MEELMKAALAATEERRAEALRVLRGQAAEVVTERGPERFLTLKECARRLGVSPCSLWRWGVPGHELGGRRRFRLSEVVKYLESGAFKRRAADLKAERRAETEGGGPVGSWQGAAGRGQ